MHATRAGVASTWENRGRGRTASEAFGSERTTARVQPGGWNGWEPVNRQREVPTASGGRAPHDQVKTQGEVGVGFEGDASAFARHRARGALFVGSAGESSRDGADRGA